GVQVVFPDQRLEEYEFVPRVKAVAGCGESLVTDGEVAGMYAFRKSFLETLNIKAKDAVMMYVSGDSMQPLICDRDTVMFNTKDTEPKEGHLYVVSFGDSLMVKRLQQIPSGWMLCSENPRYSPVSIEGDELAKLRIHGRVRWFGRVI
ncbi:MAG: helix-turn-helix transcriptional regulator, partial [Desulfovibrio sp.]|nr:helix-turn-helix transcriptional regulator [Desulfovibrio sp.]